LGFALVDGGAEGVARFVRESNIPEGVQLDKERNVGFKTHLTIIFFKNEHP